MSAREEEIAKVEGYPTETYMLPPNSLTISIGFADENGSKVIYGRRVVYDSKNTDWKREFWLKHYFERFIEKLKNQKENFVKQVFEETIFRSYKKGDMEKKKRPQTLGELSYAFESMIYDFERDTNIKVDCLDYDTEGIKKGNQRLRVIVSGVGKHSSKDGS